MLDAGETTPTTGADDSHAFTGLAAGPRTLRVIELAEADATTAAGQNVEIGCFGQDRLA